MKIPNIYPETKKKEVVSQCLGFYDPRELLVRLLRPWDFSR